MEKGNCKFARKIVKKICIFYKDRIDVDILDFPILCEELELACLETPGIPNGFSFKQSDIRDKCILYTYFLILEASEFEFADPKKKNILLSELQANGIICIKKNVTSIIDILRTISNSLISTHNHQHVLLTRYALCSILNYLYPDNRFEKILTDNDENRIIDEEHLSYLKEKFCSQTFSEPELTLLQSNIEFFVPEGQKVVCVKLSDIFTEPMVEHKETQTNTLNVLFDSYKSLGEHFHSVFKSVYKYEVNTTISMFIRSCADSLIFASDIGNRRLAEICQTLVNTNNYHSSYIYSFIEINNGKYLFSKFCAEDWNRKNVGTPSYCAIDIIGEFYKGTWQTTQSVNYFGSKLVSWLGKDAEPVLRYFIDECSCYDPHIWVAYKNSTRNGASALMDIIYNRLLSKPYSMGDDFKFDSISFFQMSTKLYTKTENAQINWLVYTDDLKEFISKHTDSKQLTIADINDGLPKYHRELINFILQTIKKLDAFPKKHHGTICQAIQKLLSDFYPYFYKSKNLIAQYVFEQTMDLDWENECYKSILKNYRNRICFPNCAPPPVLNLTEQEAVTLIKNCCLNDTLTNFDDGLNAIKAFALHEIWRYWPKEIELYKKCLGYVFNNNSFTYSDKESKAILSSVRYWSRLSQGLQESLYIYAKTFLNQNYRQADYAAIKKAVSVLVRKGENENFDIIKKLILFICSKRETFKEQLLSVLLTALFLKKDYNSVIDSITHGTDSELIELFLELFSTSNSFVFSKSLNESKHMLLINKMLDTNAFVKFDCDLQCGLIHFAKKQPGLHESLKSLSDNVDFDKLDKKTIFAFISHSHALHDGVVPKNISLELDKLLESATADIKNACKEYGASEGTLITHLCQNYASQPEKTAKLCAKAITTIYGNINYDLTSNDEEKNNVSSRRNNRKELLKILLTNPCIREFASLYSRKIHFLILKKSNNVYSDILPLTAEIINGNFPEWYDKSFEIKKQYKVETIIIKISELYNTIGSSAIEYYQTKKKGDKVSKEENLLDWLETGSTGAYKPKQDIFMFDGEIIDGLATAIWCYEISNAFRYDFEILVQKVTSKHM